MLGVYFGFDLCLWFAIDVSWFRLVMSLEGVCWVLCCSLFDCLWVELLFVSCLFWFVLLIGFGFGYLVNLWGWVAVPGCA